MGRPFVYLCECVGSLVPAAKRALGAEFDVVRVAVSRRWSIVPPSDFCFGADFLVCERQFAQDLRGNLRGQKVPENTGWKASTFNRGTTFGEITSLSIQDQRKSLPIYKLREPLLQAFREVSSNPSL